MRPPSLKFRSAALPKGEDGQEIVLFLQIKGAGANAVVTGTLRRGRLSVGDRVSFSFSSLSPSRHSSPPI